MPAPSFGFPRPAEVVGRTWSYPEVVLSSQASHASVASLSWAGATYYFIYFLIYNLFKLDCLGNLPKLIIGIAPPPFPLSDIAPTSGVEDANMATAGELLSLS